MSSRPIPKIDALTSLRGYLALWVVLYHFWNDFLVFFPRIDFLSPFMSSGNMAVPGFFILSGFVLSYNYADKLKKLSLNEIRYFLWMRLIRIYPVHIATLLMVVCMVAVSQHMGLRLTNSGYSLKDLFLNIFLVHTWVPYFQLNWNYPSWSISSEWFVYILFPFVVVYLAPFFKRSVSLILITLSCFFASILWMLYQKNVIFYELLLALPLFLMGMCIFYFSKSDERKEERAKSLTNQFVVFSLLVALFSACYLQYEVKIALIVLSLFVLIYVLSLSNVPFGSFWKGAFPIYLGDVSYSLYMSHTLAQKVLYKVLPSENFKGADFISRGIGFVFYLIVISGFCLTIYYLIEKPSLKYFKNKVPKVNTSSR